MKHANLLLVFIFFSFCSLAQKPQIRWGEEFKLRKGSTDLGVIYSDKSGVYLQEGHLALKSYFIIGASARSSASLVKLDKNLTEIYRSDFNKELKGKEFEQFFAIQDKLLIFASQYSKRDRTLSIFAAEVDKASGELAGMWKPVVDFKKEEKDDDIQFKIALNADSTQLVIVSSREGKEKNEYQIQEFTKNIESAGNPIVITNEFEPKLFQLEDVLYTVNKKVILVGRIYEYQEGKKKKEKFLDFANYNIRLYDEKGNQQKDINVNINGKWLTSSKLIQEKNQDLVLAAFYNNKRKGKTIDGMLVQRIDPVTGEIISTSEKEINNSLLSVVDNESDDDNDKNDETKAERKERERLDKIKDEGEEFSRYMKFRNIFYSADKGLVLLAEEYHSYPYSVQTYTPGVNGGMGTWRTINYTAYECGDLLMCKLDVSGNISWLNVLPKAQREVIQKGPSTTKETGRIYYSYFTGFNFPFYSGFGAMQSKQSIYLFFNDNPKNADVIRPGQKIKEARRFSKSDCFIVSIDESTGKLTRKMLFSNTDVPTSMPRLSSVLGNTMYLTGKEDRLFGKTKIALAKITVN